MAQNNEQAITSYGTWKDIDDHDNNEWHLPFTYQGNQYHAFNTGTGMDNKTQRDWIINDRKPITSLNYIARRDSPSNGDDWRTWAEGQIDKKQAAMEAYQEGGGFIETAADIDYSQFARFLDEDGNISDKGGMLTYLQTLPQFKDKSIGEIEEAMSEMPKMGIGAADLAGARGQAQSDIYGLQTGLKEERMASGAEAGASGVYSPVSTGFGGDTSTAYGQLADVSSGGANIYGLGTEEEEKFANWLGNY
tara:strand:+ start:2205 stop:2951 length:747 start_codon:yes stop_codon:yes gene_type:complete